jgi:hypothetical protein
MNALGMSTSPSPARSRWPSPRPPTSKVSPWKRMLGAYSIGLDQRLLEATPQHLRGRTLSLATSGLMLANGLGFAAAGAAAEFATPHTVIVASSLTGLLAVTLLARPVTRSIRQQEAREHQT